MRPSKSSQEAYINRVRGPPFETHRCAMLLRVRWSSSNLLKGEVWFGPRERYDAPCPDFLLPHDGLVIVAKRDCETCGLVEPVLADPRPRAAGACTARTTPRFPPAGRRDRRYQALERSWQLKVETVPTLIRFEGGREVSRIAGWDRTEWERVAQRRRSARGCRRFNRAAARSTQEPGMPRTSGARARRSGTAFAPTSMSADR